MDLNILPADLIQYRRESPLRVKTSQRLCATRIGIYDVVPFGRSRVAKAAGLVETSGSRAIQQTVGVQLGEPAAVKDRVPSLAVGLRDDAPRQVVNGIGPHGPVGPQQQG